MGPPPPGSIVEINAENKHIFHLQALRSTHWEEQNVWNEADKPHIYPVSSALIIQVNIKVSKLIQVKQTSFDPHPTLSHTPSSVANAILFSLLARKF